MNTIDLFAGCGGIYQGMESAGFRTVFANDINPDCKPTWDLNFDTELTVMGAKIALSTYKLPMKPSKLKSFTKFHKNFGKYVVASMENA